MRERGCSYRQSLQIPPNSHVHLSLTWSDLSLTWSDIISLTQIYSSCDSLLTWSDLSLTWSDLSRLTWSDLRLTPKFKLSFIGLSQKRVDQSQKGQVRVRLRSNPSRSGHLPHQKHCCGTLRFGGKVKSFLIGPTTSSLKTMVDARH